MSLEIKGELMLFLHSFGAGVFLLVVYDVLRILRRVIPHRGLIVAAEDILYWMFNALFIFYLMYRENSGSVRGYAIAGILTGMLAYNRTISPYLVRGSAWILNWIKITVFRFVKLACRPFLFLWGLTGKRFFGFIWKKYEIFKNRLKKAEKQFTIKLHKYFRSKAGRKDGKKKIRKED